MDNVKIYVTHTPNKATKKIEGSLFYNVIAGSEFQTEEVPQGFFLDNQGDNISARNKSYCELTTQYWAWKNQEADYYGFCHYRRIFNFNSSLLPESSWGNVEYDYLTESVSKELGLDEQNIRDCISGYDFLIAKGVSVDSMNAKTIYNQYELAEDLRISDIELLLEIIDRIHPELSNTARNFFDGKVFYPCNMFIMKKNLFHEYSKVLFDILYEFELRCDMHNYSREGYRTIGHLGERIAGIYYLYLKQNRNYRVKELQVALIRNTEYFSIDKVADAIPIVLAANEKYTPILTTCIQSIVDHTSDTNKYQIYIFHSDISLKKIKQITNNYTHDNVSIVFVDVNSYTVGYKLQAKQHITSETFYRFFILEILKDYPKVVYLDADLIVCRDVAELFNTDLKENLIAGVVDADFAGQCNIKSSDMIKYCQNILKLENPYRYFQAGVLLMNVGELRKKTSVGELVQMAETGIYRFSDQDILNIVCKDKVLYLDMAWNVLTDCNHSRWNNVIKHAPYYLLDAYEKARENPYILHYAGFMKPWMRPDEDFADVFWNVSRKTNSYEVLLYNMLKGDEGSAVLERKSKMDALEVLRKIMRHVFPKKSRARVWAIKIYFKLRNLS